MLKERNDLDDGVGQKVKIWELTIIALVLMSSLLIHIWLIDPVFNGPDARSNFEFAVLGQDWDWWLDPSAFHSYLFPMFYGTFFAIVTRFSDGDFLAVQYLQIAMALAMALFAWQLTRYISVGVRIATLVAAAFSPALFGLARMNGYEILLGFLLTASVVILWGKGGNPSKKPRVALWFMACTSGLLFGLAMLTQGKISIMYPVLGFMAWRWGRTFFITFMLSSVFPVALWSLRNALVINTWNPFNSSSGVVMWLGTNPYTRTGEYSEVPPVPEGMSFSQAAIQYAISQPEAAFSLLLRRMVRLVEPTYIYFDPGNPSIFQSALHVLFMLISLVGFVFFMAFLFGRIWTGPPTLPPVGALAIIVLLFFLVHIPFATETRHMKPMSAIAIAVIVPTAYFLFVRYWASFRGFMARKQLRPKLGE